MGRARRRTSDERIEARQRRAIAADAGKVTHALERIRAKAQLELVEGRPFHIGAVTRGPLHIGWTAWVVRIDHDSHLVGRLERIGWRGTYAAAHELMGNAVSLTRRTTLLNLNAEGSQ